MRTDAGRSPFDRRRGARRPRRSPRSSPRPRRSTSTGPPRPPFDVLKFFPAEASGGARRSPPFLARSRTSDSCRPAASDRRTWPTTPPCPRCAASEGAGWCPATRCGQGTGGASRSCAARRPTGRAPAQQRQLSLGLRAGEARATWGRRRCGSSWSTTTWAGRTGIEAATMQECRLCTCGTASRAVRTSVRSSHRRGLLAVQRLRPRTGQRLLAQFRHHRRPRRPLGRAATPGRGWWW
jgi:hypothetical protein